MNQPCGPECWRDVHTASSGCRKHALERVQGIQRVGPARAGAASVSGGVGGLQSFCRFPCPGTSLHCPMSDFGSVPAIGLCRTARVRESEEPREWLVCTGLSALHCSGNPLHCCNLQQPFQNDPTVPVSTLVSAQFQPSCQSLKTAPSVLVFLESHPASFLVLRPSQQCLGEQIRQQAGHDGWRDPGFIRNDCFLFLQQRPGALHLHRSYWR